MKIVAFVDRSIYAQSVVDHAIWLARATNASVELLAIIAPNELLANSAPLHPGGPVLLVRDETLSAQVSRLEEEAQAQLDRALDSLTSHGVAAVSARVLEGNLAEVMLKAASSATVVVMGKRGEHADLARLPLGTNFERFVRSSRVPVLAVSRGFRPVHRALLPVDLDPSAASAIEAIGGGILPRMPVQLLHVGQKSEAIELELGRATVRLSDAGFPASAEIEQGIARIVVPERVVTGDFDLVAMGAFGSSRLKSLLFGSLTTELIRACQVPILLCQ